MVFLNKFQILEQIFVFEGIQIFFVIVDKHSDPVPGSRAPKYFAKCLYRGSEKHALVEKH